MVRSVLVMVALTALGCGRRNFETSTDAAGGGPSDAGASPHLAFVTSTLHTGDLGGLEGADAICQERAAAAGLPGSYIAYLGAGGEGPGARLNGNRGWQRVDGAPVIDSPSQLTLLRAWNPIFIDELGQDIRGSNLQVWTGAAAAGTAAASCSDWSDTDAEGNWGNASAGAASAYALGPASCSNARRLYCFGIGGERPISPPAPSAGRLAFLSNGYFAPSLGVAAADAQCQTEASAEGHDGSFKALLAPQGETAASRFSTEGEPWVRADGVALVDTPGQLFSGALLNTHLAMSASGDPVAAYETRFWAGNPLLVLDPNDNCEGWQSDSGADHGMVGEGDETELARRFRHDDGPMTCNTSTGVRLLCLEE